MRDAVVVFLEHLALLEGMINRALVVRARLLKHVVELATTTSRGPRGPLRSGAAAKASSESSACPEPRWFGGTGFFPFLPRFCFLAGALNLGLLPSAGRVFLVLAQFVVEDGTNSLRGTGFGRWAARLRRGLTSAVVTGRRKSWQAEAC